MLQRFGGLRHQLRRACEEACHRQGVLVFGACGQRGALEVPMSQHSCVCSVQQVCAVHGSVASYQNPDNKPTPPGRDQNDPTNVKYDTPTKDPADSSDWAPGWYDDKGRGGHREVASHKQSDQIPGSPPHSDRPGYVPGDMPRDWKPEQAEDPLKPKPKDPNAADIPDMQVRREDSSNSPNSAADANDPNKDPPVGQKTQVAAGSMPDKRSGLAGMQEPEAPPQTADASAPPEEKATPYNDSSPLDRPSTPGKPFTGPGDNIEKHGGVRVGEKPDAPGADETHRYK